MRSLTGLPLTWRKAGALAALAAAVLLAPATARAGCGGYVTHGEPTDESGPARPAPVSPGTVPQPVPAPRPAQPLPPSCPGPVCSHDRTPLAPPVPPTPPAGDEWAWVTPLFFPDADGHSGRRPDRDVRPGPCVRSSVYHPPRHGHQAN
jgi:hypothetical protein